MIPTWKPHQKIRHSVCRQNDPSVSKSGFALNNVIRKGTRVATVSVFIPCTRSAVLLFRIVPLFLLGLVTSQLGMMKSFRYAPATARGLISPQG